MRRRLLVVLGVLALAPAGAGATSGTAEWPSLRGPNFDGSAASGSVFRGPEGAELVVAWRAALGPGYSGVAVSGGRAVTLFSDGKDDVAAAFDAASGKELWRTAVGPTYEGRDGSFDGPISTPAIAEGRVFTLGPRGHLAALDLAGGRVLWRTDVEKDHGARKPYYGFGASLLVAGGTLVVELGGESGRAIAGFDPASGKRRWTLGDDAVSYQSPVVLSVGGREQVVAVGNSKLFAVEPATGRLLWSHEHGGEAQPIAAESLVPVPAGEGRLFLKNRSDSSTMLRIQPKADGSFAAEVLWKAPVLRTTYSIPVYHEGHLYGLNGRTVLTCVDAATGEMRWRSREPGDGFLLRVGGDLVVLTKERTLHVGPASPEGWKERARIELFRDVVWTPPSFAGGAVFARSQGEIARVEWRGAAAAAPPKLDLPPGSRFARFLAEVEAATDKSAAVDRFLESITSYPLREWPDLVVFLYRGPADDMGIAGDLIGERREDPMHRVAGTDLFWYATRVEPDARLSYVFVRNYEERIPDPRNPRRAPAQRFTPQGPVTIEVSSLAVPGWKDPAHLEESPEARRGRIETHELQSAARPGTKVSLHVYLPAGYEVGTQRLPAAYVLGGDQARTLGAVPRSLDNLIGRSVEPLIAVFVGRIDWGSQSPGDDEAGDAEAALVANEMVPFVDARYRTVAEAACRAAVAAGFDGWSAAYAAFRHPEVFGALGIQSLFMLETGEDQLKKRIRTAGEQPLRLYLEWGRYDLRATREAWDNRQMNRRFDAFLRERGYRPAGGEVADGFGWASWRVRTDRLFETLFPARPTP
jgi:outer membrane protein assembly factor BamB/enterochelin esterase-like enzyme